MCSFCFGRLFTDAPLLTLTDLAELGLEGVVILIDSLVFSLKIQ